MAIRLKDGENLLKAHRRHFYQLLTNEMGITHWKVLVWYGVYQLIVGLAVLLVRSFGVLDMIILLCIFFVGFIWDNYFVRGKNS
jgi:Fuc2NAc and GlcNAc transferase